MENNLDHICAIDRAWNNRNWDDYSGLLSDDLVAYSSGELLPQTKQEHIEAAKMFCRLFPDNKVQLEPYLALFEGKDGMTCSVARIGGTLMEELSVDGEVTAPDNQSFDVTFTAICKWRDGKIFEQREFFDTELMKQQLKNK